jgi:hypothetical protein
MDAKGAQTLHERNSFHRDFPLAVKQVGERMLSQFCGAITWFIDRTKDCPERMFELDVIAGFNPLCKIDQT